MGGLLSSYRGGTTHSVLTQKYLASEMIPPVASPTLASNDGIETSEIMHLAGALFIKTVTQP